MPKLKAPLRAVEACEDQSTTAYVTRKEALERGLKRYFTGKACPHGHVEERYVCDTKCVGCSREKALTYYTANRETELVRLAAMRAAERAGRPLSAKAKMDACRSEAREKGLKRFFTGDPCKRGHVSERYVSSAGCVECHLTYNKARNSTPEGKALRAEWTAARNATPEWKAYQEAYYIDNKAAARATHLKNTFGITMAYYDFLLANQGGVCAHCREPETMVRSGKVSRLAVDHCHDTGAVRGLLCTKCNTALGNIGDTVESLREATRYLTGESLPHPPAMPPRPPSTPRYEPPNPHVRAT